jgi:hypothetical protein
VTRLHHQPTNWDLKEGLVAEKEYRYGCSIDCGGTPLRVYARELGSHDWDSYEDYLSAPTFVWYNNSDGSSSDYAWLPGHWLSEQEPPGEGSMYYQDSFGVQVVGGDFDPQQEPPEKRLPEYLIQDLIDNLWRFFPPIRGIITWSGSWPHPSEIFAPPPPPPTPPSTPPPTAPPPGSWPRIGSPYNPPSEPGNPGLPSFDIWFPPIGNFTNKGCRAACDAAFTKSAARTACYEICNTLGGKNCNALWARCQHIGRHQGEWAFKVCLTLYNALCPGE